MNKLVNKALEIAVVAHGGQVDKGGNPYALHPIAVALACQTDEEKVVALLHDIAEDTEMTAEDLEKEFPSYIVEAVVAITRNPLEPRGDYIHRVKENELARKVKIQDLKHNCDLSRLALPTDEDKARVVQYLNEISYLEA